jgi:N-sulfoglucosamine sulfohydrolase
MKLSLSLLTALLLSPLAALHAASGPALKPPNILWLIAEDACPDFGCYGNTAARTPNIDRLARESRLYRNAFSTASVCSASRSAFMTGVFQTRFGASNHRSHRTAAHPRPPGVRLLPERLREAGYFTANIRELPPELGFKGTGKTDWNFFQTGKEFDSANWSDLKARAPFYAQINFTESHRVYHRAATNPTDPAAVNLPPYLADDPVIRDDWAAYLDSLAALDAKVGAVLDLLRRDGLAENTVVFFFADHGREDFRGKYYSYEQGFRVPLLVRWPALLPPDSVSDALVSLLDVHATTLALAGAPAEGLDGAPMFGLGAKPRDYVFGARDRIDDTPDRVRTVRDARFKLIRNFEPERPCLQRMAYAEVSNPTYNRMRRLYAEGKLNAVQRKFMAASRAPEELYDLQTDPFELRNLAADPRHRATLDRLRAVLAAWLKDTRDESAAPEDPVELDAQLKNLEKIVAGHRQNLGPTGLLESVSGAPEKKD